MKSHFQLMKRLSLLLLTIAFAMTSVPHSQLYAASDELRPRIVEKNFDEYGEVPAGMHLKRTRTGELWLLPIGMDKPPKAEIYIEYYKRPKNSGEPKVIGKIGTQIILDSPVNAIDTFVDPAKFDFYGALPEQFANLLKTDKHSNLHAKESPDLLSLGRFGPAEDEAFYLPYIPMPADALDFAYLSELAQEHTSKLVKFKKDGKDHYRFFIHPNYVDSESYVEFIKKYGIVYHYIAMTTSSPRSLIVLDPENLNEVHWVKPSLHKKIDGSVRTNHDSKVRRAVIMSEAMARVPKEARREMQVALMVEPAALFPRGKQVGTIFREVAPEMLSPEKGHHWLPALSLKAEGSTAGHTILSEMVSRSQQKPSQFVKDSIVRPLLRAFLTLGIIEGLPGELHVQNFYYEIGPKGIPTGKLLLKDNDGFRFDVEMAMRNGRGLDFLSEFDKPFYWAKYSNARGFGAEGVPFLGSWYYKLIRNVNGFETLSAYSLSVLQTLEPKAGWDKDSIQRLFDDVASEEAEKLTGRKVTPNEYGFGYDKGINIALNTHRANLSIATLAQAEEIIANDLFQVALSEEFYRLEKEKRVSSLNGYPSKTSRFLLHVNIDGSVMIEAMTLNPRRAHDPTIGFALLESEKTKAGSEARKRLADAYEKSGLSKKAVANCEVLLGRK